MSERRERAPSRGGGQGTLAGRVSLSSGSGLPASTDAQTRCANIVWMSPTDNVCGLCRFAALRSIVVCFLEAVPLLVSVAAMLFFFLFIFAGEFCACSVVLGGVGWGWRWVGD